MQRAAARLIEKGWDTHTTRLDRITLKELHRCAFTHGAAGQRCLLDVESVQTVAKLLRTELIGAGVLPDDAVAIQAIAFDKTPGTNWKVTWHQDLMFPFAKATTTPGYDLPSTKDGIAYARPPREVLEELLAVRLHVDDCDTTNGPLRVATGSHRHGILRSADIPDVMSRHEEATCLAATDEALLMKPLLLHASSPALEPRHSRVLHYVFHSGRVMAETWHRRL